MDGNLNVAFNFTDHRHNLITVDVSNNGFTGTLPFDLFSSSRSLEEFIGGSNCFSGTISSEICNATSLKTLDLSGMRAGANCAHRVNLALIHFYSTDTVHGSIPSCLFSSTSLAVLSIAANGIRSALGDLASESLLRNLTLSYNRIQQTIPLSMKLHPDFDLLDLSYNELSGTLENTVWFENTSRSGPILSMTRNRLSGDIPYSFHAAKSISILDGNMFYCSSAESLPVNDPDSGNYICGSDLANTSLFVFTALMAVFTILGIAVVRGLCCTGTATGPALTEALREMAGLLWRDGLRVSSGSRDVDHLDSMLWQFRRAVTVLLLCVLCLVLPVYCVLKFYADPDFSSYTYQYGWSPSLGFMQHTGPANVILALCVVVLPAVAWFDWNTSKLFRHLETRTFSHATTHPDIPAVSANKSRWLIVLVSLNIVVVMAVNMAYVDVVLTQSVRMQVLVIGLLSIFKMGWSVAIINIALRYLNGNLRLFKGLSILNNVILPAVGTALADISCFQNMFRPGSTLTSTLVIGDYVCKSAQIVNTISGNSSSCIGPPLIVGSQMEPPFIYSGQCSGALLSNYIPVYVIMYGVLNITLHILQLCVLCVFRDVQPRADGTFWEHWLFKFKQNPNFYAGATLGIVHFRLLPISISVFTDGDGAASFAQFMRSDCISMYSLRELAVALSTSGLLLVTYGAAYPPLAVVLFVDMMTSTLLRQLCVHRHLAELRGRCDTDADVLLAWHRALRYELDHVAICLFDYKPSRVLIGVFVSLFVYDMLIGDGPNLAMMYVVGLLIWTFLTAVVSYGYDQKQRKHLIMENKSKSERRTSSTYGNITELVPVAAAVSVKNPMNEQ